MTEISIENQNQVSPITHHVRELEVLYKISRLLTAGTGQKQALAEVLDILDSELGMNRGLVTLLSADGSEIMIEVAHNLSAKDIRKVRYRMGEGIFECPASCWTVWIGSFCAQLVIQDRRRSWRVNSFTPACWLMAFISPRRLFINSLSGFQLSFAWRSKIWAKRLLLMKT